MSLINDVLRDLERRRNPGAGGSLRGVRPPLAPERSAGRLWLGAFVLVPLVAGAIWWGVQRTESAESVPAPVLLAAAVAEPATPEPTPPIERSAGTRLTGIALSQSADRLQLVLSLKGPVVHRVDRSEGGRRVLLGVDDARLQAALPPLASVDGLLRGLDVRQEAGRLLLDLEFALPARVQTVLEPGADGSVIVIDVRPAEPAATAAALPRSPPAAEHTGSTVQPVMASTPEPVTATPPAATEQAAFQKTPRQESPFEMAARAYADGVGHARAGRREQAAAAWERALAHDPAHRDARVALVELFTAAGRAEQATDLLRQAHARWPEDSDYAERYARLLVGFGRERDAVAALEAGRPPLVGDGEYLALLGALYQRLGRYADSAEAYGRVLTAHPQREVWWMGLAISLEGAGQAGPAARAYRRALALPALSAELRKYAEARLAALPEA